jgi:hypothetical protein
MMTCVLGAPGSGKSTVAALLSERLPSHVVLDWDAFMGPASELAGRDVTRSPDTWPAYGRLVRLVVAAVAPTPLVMLGVCTPDELDAWPIDAWVLLECGDDERRQRLATCLEPAEVEAALADARHYRTLGLPVIDSTGRAPEAVAVDLARVVRDLEASKAP